MNETMTQKVDEMKSKWDFPLIKRCDLIPDWLIAYRRRLPKTPGIGATHFFLDDFRFESIWNNPEGSTKYLKTPVVLSPDFSIHYEWPIALQIWNTYRNRWCGAFWQSQGLSVIPTVSWSNPDSFGFCFDSIEPGGVVAIATVGLQNNLAARLGFRAGFDEMNQRLRPKQILCYGKLPEEIETDVTITTYPTFWQKKGK